MQARIAQTQKELDALEDTSPQQIEVENIEDAAADSVGFLGGSVAGAALANKLMPIVVPPPVRLIGTAVGGVAGGLLGSEYTGPYIRDGYKYIKSKFKD